MIKAENYIKNTNPVWLLVSKVSPLDYEIKEEMTQLVEVCHYQDHHTEFLIL